MAFLPWGADFPASRSKYSEDVRPSPSGWRHYISNSSAGPIINYPYCAVCGAGWKPDAHVQDLVLFQWSIRARVQYVLIAPAGLGSKSLEPNEQVGGQLTAYTIGLRRNFVGGSENSR